MFDDSVWSLIANDQSCEPVSLKPGHCSWSTGEETQNEPGGINFMLNKGPSKNVTDGILNEALGTYYVPCKNFFIWGQLIRPKLPATS